MEQLKVDIDDLSAFFLVVETGSFARAADRLGTSKSIISRRVMRLEETLAARLLTRGAKGTQPTDVGQTYYERAREALAQLEAAGEAVAEAVSDVAGPIRLSGPLSFGVSHLARALSEFASAYPRVELDISFDDHSVDLVGGGYDLAVRIGELADSSLVAKRIGKVHTVTVASPAYLDTYGCPDHPDDLSHHRGIHYTNVAPTVNWRFADGDSFKSYRINGVMRSDNGDMMLEAAKSGLGIARLPTFIASRAIQSGEVEAILKAYERPPVPMHAVMPPGRATTARVRALVSFLHLKFGTELL